MSKIAEEVADSITSDTSIRRHAALMLALRARKEA
jgi:hypothetical protein